MLQLIAWLFDPAGIPRAAFGLSRPVYFGPDRLATGHVRLKLPEDIPQTQQWLWNDRTLYLTAMDGTERVPTADEIYDVLVEHKASPIRAGALPSGLSVSRYPVIPVLVLALDETGVPFTKLIGRYTDRSGTLYVADLERGHVVLSGTWFPVDSSAAGEILGVLSRASISPGEVQSLQAFLNIRRAATPRGVVEDDIGDRSVAALVFAPSDGEAPNVLVPLYPYQLDGWRWLRFVRSEGLGGILADEMGLGKTLQVIATIADTRHGQSSFNLVIAPSSLLENWRREISRFAPALKVLKHQGAGRTGSPGDLCSYDVVITSYDTAVRDSGLLGVVDWDMLVLDEAQFIRNPDAQRSKAVKRLKRRVGLAVTGTPMENRLLDLWSIVDFVLPGQLGDRKDFEERFTDDLEGARLLETEVSPFMLRRRVADVATDLPPRIDIPQVVVLAEREAVEYERIRGRIADRYGAAATLVSLMVLRMFCAHPAIVPENPLTDPMEFGKFQRLNEILEEIFARREKVLIFTSFTAMADMIATHIHHSFHAWAGVLDGRLPIDDRQPMIDAFSSVADGAALVLNPRAGGTGLNIAAANHVIHYNPEWNPALEDQASARAHRRGQALPVTIHHLLVANTIEEVIGERLERKRSVSEAAVVGVAGRDQDYSDIAAALSRSPLP